MRVSKYKTIQVAFFMVNMAKGMDRGHLPAQKNSLDIHPRAIDPFQRKVFEVRWPVSRDHIASSGLELKEVIYFF